MAAPPPRLILASGSPRRRALLEGIHVTFAVRPANLDESILEDETPEAHVRRLASAKSRYTIGRNELVLAADTVVVVDDEILGKPTDESTAIEMLTRLSGRRHVVLTGVAVTLGSSHRTRIGVERSEVEISPLGRQEIEWYVGTGEPLDKAGSYAIQGLGALFVTAVDGNYTNVVGLPLPLTRRLFREVGFDLLEFRRTDGS